MRHPTYGVQEVAATITPGVGWGGGRGYGSERKTYNISVDLAKSDRGGGLVLKIVHFKISLGPRFNLQQEP